MNTFIITVLSSTVIAAIISGFISLQINKKELKVKLKLEQNNKWIENINKSYNDYINSTIQYMDDLKKRMGNAILTEMRNVDKEERTSLFRQKIAARQLYTTEKGNQGTLFQRYNGSGNQQLHVSVIRLKQAMRKTFHDYKFERHMDEFDQMMEKD